MFQHTAARRRLFVLLILLFYVNKVSTHSRPKAAVCIWDDNQGEPDYVSTHSRPKAAV